MSSKYFVQICQGGVELEVASGPFATHEERDASALAIRQTLDPIKDGLFWLDLADDGTPTSGSFSDAATFDEEDDVTNVRSRITAKRSEF